MPTVDKLLPRLLAIVALSVAFVAMTMAITAGWFNTLDIQVAEEMHSLWQESLHPLFQLIAELGGFELTTILMVGLFFYLWRGRFGADALVVAAFAGAVALEILYKSLLFHPGPPHSLSHSDGPSVSELLPRGALGNSFPSGHTVRAVVAYGFDAVVPSGLPPTN